MLRVDELVKTYAPPAPLLRPLIRVAASEPVPALRGVSLRVDPGEILGVVGPNGAGKTTLVKIVATLLEPSGGEVLVDGVDVTRDPVRARRRIGLMFADDRVVYQRLTGRQNLEFFGVISGLSRPEARRRADALLERLDLARRDKQVFGYSSGMRSRLNLARALLAEPALLLLDEPTRSLDPLATAFVEDLLVDLASEGRAILLASHDLGQVAARCHRLVVIIDGQCRFTGTPAEVETTGKAAAAAMAEMLAREATVP